ncbi:MAG TPA: transketolase [Bacteroidales bacterium]|nr:transketolase [Bacteroidales bacterium]
MKKSIQELELIAQQVRRDIIRMVHSAKSGHPGGSLGCADILTALYFDILNIEPSHFSIDGKQEDMFFLSNGHISPVFYSVLARRGYFPIKELGTFRKMGSRLQGHPTPSHHLPGIRVASGSLGQGLSVAVGASLAKKANNDSGIIYVLTGDGELQEGQNWEAIMFAASNKVDNLIAIVDYNQKQIDGDTDSVCSLGDLDAKFRSFGWNVFSANGNSMSEVVNVLHSAKKSLNQKSPIVLLMKTEMGMGVDFMMGTHKWHGSPPNDQQAEKALQQIPVTIGDY